MTTLMPFQASKLKLARARYHADAFREQLDDGDAEALASTLRRFVRDLRAALDSTIVDIARVRSKDTYGLAFPFAETARNLSDLIDVEIRGIDEELGAYLKGLRLYRGGGSALFVLHDLGHDARLAITATASGNSARFAADHAALAGQPVEPVMERLLQTVTETVAELGSRFWARP